MTRIKLMDWVVCGRLIGQASGWDQADTFGMQLYDFVPAKDYAGPIGKDICISFEQGTIETFDKKGKTVESKDLIESIANCARRVACSSQGD